MDIFEALDLSKKEFAKRLAAVQPQDWDLPTPCSEWRVRELVNHVVGGCRMYTMLLNGTTPPDLAQLRSMDHLGDDPADALDCAATEMMDAFREPGALSRTVHHPSGDRPAETLAAMRVGEFAVHGWDLARSIGADEQLDPSLVHWLWPVLSAMAPGFSGGSWFRAPAGELDGDASLQDRLLHLTGREP